MTIAQPNRLLARLSKPVLAELFSNARIVDLQAGRVLVEASASLCHVYFPHSGTISNVVDLIGGPGIETSFIGRDGVFGATGALDDQISLNRVIVQATGIATVLPSARVVTLANRYPEFRKLVLGYEHFNYAQAQQTAACNAAHSVQSRFCRWLLRLHELNGIDLKITHEFFSHMMGVRRTSITEVAHELAKLGAIQYSRGRLRILDIEKLQMHACECHDALQQSYDQLFPHLDAGKHDMVM